MTAAQTTISTILQLIVFLLVPLVAWLFIGRKTSGFFEYLGLTTPTRRALIFALLFFLIALPFASLFFFLPNLHNATSAPNTVTGQLKALGFSASSLIQLLIIAIFKTAFSEELLFRGFIAKRLIANFGFLWGNTLQAVIFGAVHLLVFLAQPFAWLPAAAFFLLPGLGGWATGYLNERIGDGSILPGWVLHALINISAYLVLAFW